tara:strand:+ start:58 stop:672 length:615 start_codon:yes stop_codon:yes gene_type:complete
MMNWEDIIKKPYPNQWLSNKRRGQRPVIAGSGPAGLFHYSELDKIDDAVATEVDAAYRVETAKAIKAARKTNKDVDIKSITEAMDKQKKNNVYATSYGTHNTPNEQTVSFSRDKKGWFGGGFKKLGYNPDSPTEITAAKKRISYTGKRYFVEDSPSTVRQPTPKSTTKPITKPQAKPAPKKKEPSKKEVMRDRLKNLNLGNRRR